MGNKYFKMINFFLVAVAFFCLSSLQVKAEDKALKSKVDPENIKKFVSVKVNKIKLAFDKTALKAIILAEDYEDLKQLYFPEFCKLIYRPDDDASIKTININNDELKEIIKIYSSAVWEKSLELIFQGRSEYLLEYLSRDIIVNKWMDNVILKAEKSGKLFMEKEAYRLVMKSKEGATKGNLAALRSAITIYYSEKEGVWPKDITTGFENYLFPIPPEKITGSNRVVNEFDGKGGWYYIIDPKSDNCGNLFPNIEGKDSAGTEYSKY